MRHAARTPPPPVFITCVLLRLTSSWKLHSFRVSGPAFAVTWLLLVLRRFSALCLGPGGELLKRYDRIDARSLLQVMNNEAKGFPQSVKSHSKLAPGALWGSLGR